MSTYLAKCFCLGMFLETEGRKVDARAKDSRLCKDTDPSDSVQFHFHVLITIRVAKVCEMRPPRSVLGVSFDDDRIFI